MSALFSFEMGTHVLARLGSAPELGTHVLARARGARPPERPSRERPREIEGVPLRPKARP